jgi:hypothetical protein
VPASVQASQETTAKASAEEKPKAKWFTSKMRPGQITHWTYIFLSII